MKKLLCLIISLIMCCLFFVGCEKRYSYVTVNTCFNFRCEAVLSSTNQEYIVKNQTAKEIYNYSAQAKTEQTENSGQGASLTLYFVGDKIEEPKSADDSAVICTYVIYENDVFYYNHSSSTSIVGYYSDGLYNLISTLVIIYS